MKPKIYKPALVRHYTLSNGGRIKVDPRRDRNAGGVLYHPPMVPAQASVPISRANAAELLAAERKTAHRFTFHG